MMTEIRWNVAFRADAPNPRFPTATEAKGTQGSVPVELPNTYAGTKLLRPSFVSREPRDQRQINGASSSLQAALHEFSAFSQPPRGRGPRRGHAVTSDVRY